MIEVEVTTVDEKKVSNPNAPKTTRMGRMRGHKKGVGRMTIGRQPQQMTTELANAAVSLLVKGHTIRQVSNMLDLHTDQLVHLVMVMKERFAKENNNEG